MIDPECATPEVENTRSGSFVRNEISICRSCRNYHRSRRPILLLKKTTQFFRRTDLRREFLIFAGAICLYVCNELIFKKLPLHKSLFFSNHFNDMLAPALLLSYSTVLVTIAGFARIIRFWRVFALTLACGVFWEYVTPLYLARSTSDPLDLVFYMVGFFVYWTIAKSFFKSRE